MADDDFWLDEEIWHAQTGGGFVLGYGRRGTAPDYPCTFEEFWEIAFDLEAEIDGDKKIGFAHEALDEEREERAEARGCVGAVTIELICPSCQSSKILPVISSARSHLLEGREALFEDPAENEVLLGCAACAWRGTAKELGDRVGSIPSPGESAE